MVPRLSGAYGKRVKALVVPGVAEEHNEAVRREALRSRLSLSVLALLSTQFARAQVQEFRVNTYTTSQQAFPSLAIDSSGNFVVVWQSYEQSGGCGGGSYCPEAPVRRDQMAVFLLKARYGSSYVPPPCVGVFLDVPCPGPFADWIEQLFSEGVTVGCGDGNYCQWNPVTRAQMAVFLLKAKYSLNYVPPPCSGIFADVPCPSMFADWIEQLFHEGITAGCGEDQYCPNGSITRGQIAVFLVKAFGLKLYGP